MDTLSNKTGVVKMRTSMGLLALLLMAVAILSLAAVAPTPWADEEDDDGNEIPFDEANIFFELNDTDGDLGIHALIDGEPWKRLEIEDPNERTILSVRNKGRLRQQGLTELFFESAEPPFDELPPAEFLLRFPEGEYEISGITLEGDELESTVALSHVLAAPVGNVMVNDEQAAENCDVVPLPSVSEPVTIDWDPVTTSHPEIGKPGPVEIVRYQFVVEQGDLNFSVDLLPDTVDVTQFMVPSEIIAQGDKNEPFKFEIIARTATGNNTAIESCFEVE